MSKNGLGHWTFLGLFSENAFVTIMLSFSFLEKRIVSITENYIFGEKGLGILSGSILCERPCRICRI
jgi:hypothetical protein